MVPMQLIPTGGRDWERKSGVGEEKEKESIFFSIIFLWKQLHVCSLGRDPETSYLQLEAAGVQVNPHTKKIVGVHNEQTSVPHIHAIGDVLQVCCHVPRGFYVLCIVTWWALKHVSYLVGNHLRLTLSLSKFNMKIAKT